MRYLAFLIFSAVLHGASLDGVPVHFTVTGNAARTLILVPGWTCDETSWDANVPELSKTYRVVTVDLPGHGKSAPPRDGIYSIDMFARAVEAVRSELRAERVVLGGHSMGAAVVAQYAHLYPQHAAALVFVDGYFGLPEKASTQPQVVPAGFNQQRESSIRGMFSAATIPEVQKHILSMMMGPTEAAAVGAMNALQNPPAWGQDVLPLPIFGIYQEKGNFVSAAVKAHFPDFHAVQIPGTGHFLMLEKPAEFNRILLGFLDSLKW